MTNLITLTNPQSPVAEAYRTFRTNLMFYSVDKPLHTLLITSVSAPEDKSDVVANLAVTFAQSGHKTILVDADLRRPSQHTIWGVDNARGFTTMMTESATLANPPLVATSVENLSLLPSGALPPVPSDLLSNQRMSEIIGILKARADYVIFDAPPILSATDASLLASKLDGVVLAVRAGKTRRDHLSQAQQSLARVHVKLLGTILTNAPRERAKKY
ncbi:MAG: CpsD/CapB family tyrosine-protein kinase [Anaerolineae bacterium]|nr:CpsD/CapB family tyrosine-protein kinase [Anaerolineae bacterium]